MPTQKAISNPAGLWGLTADTDAQYVVEVVNGSGGTLLPGDVVIASGVAGTTVTTVAGASSKLVVGVVLPMDRGLRTVAATETYAAGAVMPVCIAGPARINIAANVVVAGDPLSTSAVAKVAAVAGAAASVAALQALIGSFIGTALEATAAKDANNTILAWIAKM